MVVSIPIHRYVFHRDCIVLGLERSLADVAFTLLLVTVPAWLCMAQHGSARHGKVVSGSVNRLNCAGIACSAVLAQHGYQTRASMVQRGSTWFNAAM